jgi:hypothetical protein
LQADAVKDRAVRGNESVDHFRDDREARQLSVEREPETLATRVAQGQETGLGRTGMEVAAQYPAIALADFQRAVAR